MHIPVREVFFFFPLSVLERKLCVWYVLTFIADLQPIKDVTKSVGIPNSTCDILDCYKQIRNDISTLPRSFFLCDCLNSRTSHKTKPKPYCNTTDKVVAFQVKPGKRLNIHTPQHVFLPTGSHGVFPGASEHLRWLTSTN